MTQVFNIYCDKSHQELFGSSDKRRKGRFVLIGGLWIEAPAREDIKVRIKELRYKHALHAEIEALEQRRDKIKQIKQGMMQVLLTGRARLVRPDPVVGKGEEQ